MENLRKTSPWPWNRRLSPSFIDCMWLGDPLDIWIQYYCYFYYYLLLLLLLIVIISLPLLLLLLMVVLQSNKHSLCSRNVEE